MIVRKCQFDLSNFREEIRSNIKETNSYEMFETIFLGALNKHAPIKSRKVRANDKPFMTKVRRRAEID